MATSEKRATKTASRWATCATSKVEPVWTAEDIAAHFGMSAKWARAQIASGVFSRKMVIGRQVFIPDSAVAEYIEKSTFETRQEL